jgi:hypothetical protein
MAARGKLLDVTQLPGPAPLGSSGIQIRFETDLITEGMRPTRIVKVRPQAGRMSTCPAKSISATEPPTSTSASRRPAIFPKY